LVSDPAQGRFGCESQGVNAGIETYNCSGNELLYAPEFGADLSVNHVVNFGEYDLSLTAVASHRAEQETNFLFLNETASDSYTMFNVDATLYADQSGWSISAFVRNLTDEQFTMNTNVSNRGLAYGIWSPPRTYGVRFMANFK